MTTGLRQAARHATRLRPLHLLVAVACASFALQMLVTDPHRFFGWDESIYLAEALSDRPSIEWGAHRARGVPLLLAPVTAVAGAGAAVRVYMAAITAGLILLAYACWLSTLRWGAVWAAAVFAFSWLALAQGSEALPNIPAALCAVGVAGAYVGRLVGRATGPSGVALVGFGCGLALLRPTETVPLAAVLVAGGAWWWARSTDPGRTRRLASATGLLALGMALGWAQWAVEAATTFGGPLQRLRAAADLLPGRPDSPWAVLRVYLDTLDGPLAVFGEARPWLVAVVWVAFLLAGCALSMVGGERPTRFIGPLCVAASVALLAWYLFYNWIEVRFLAPSWALASVAVGLGFTRLRPVASRKPAAVAAAAAAAVAAVSLVPWHFAIAHELATYQTQVAEDDRAAARAMRLMADGSPCAFYADYGAPQLELASRCEGTPIATAEARKPPTLAGHLQAGVTVFVALRTDPPPGSFVDGWDVHTVPTLHGTDWSLYTPPGQPAPRSDPGGQATRS